MGSFCIAAISALLLPFCESWTPYAKLRYTVALTVAGFSGTLLDSFLGAVLQASVVDVHSGKVVEGEGGRKVIVHGSNHPRIKESAKIRSKLVSFEEGKDAIAKSSGVDNSVQASKTMQKAGVSGSEVTGEKHESRKVAVGLDILDNNAVNILMAALVSVGTMIAACVVWELPISSIIPV